MASRILGMGDVLTLVERAQEAADLEQAAKLEEKLRKESLTLEDFFEQLQALKKMGPLEQLVGMIPGMSKAGPVAVDEGALARIEAIINSMTPRERRDPSVIDGSRRRRIASGSGTTVQDINRLLKQFGEMKKLMKQFGRQGKRGRPPFVSPFGA
jgi:signal recognition particle subunit SRP54